MVNKVDSNTTGLRFAEETSMGVVAADAVWHPAEPNSYGDFGGEYTQVARTPINPSRQRRKGTITDKDAVASVNVDFTKKGLYRLLSGFMFADWREKPSKAVTAASGTAYTVASSTGIAIGDLVFAEGFAVPGNNGLKAVTAVTGTSLSAPGLAVEASPPADAKVTKVGAQAGAADVTVTVVAGVVALVSTTLNFTTLGLIPGEWIFIGGDAAATQFATAANNGWARVKSVAANAIVLDRMPGTMVADAGTGKTIQIFVGHVIKNETDPALIKTKSIQFERSYPSVGEYEYVKGCVPNTFEIAITNADKIAVDLGYVAIDTEDLQVAKTGTRPVLGEDEVYNSANDFSNLRMLNDDTAATLFTYVTEMNLSINNGVEALKAVGVLGAFDVSIGDFVAAGNCTAYFTSAEAVRAVKTNADVSLDLGLVKGNVGWVIDIPLLTLGDARRTVEKDQAVMLPITMEGVEHPTLHHTLLVGHYPYLPNAAE